MPVIFDYMFVCSTAHLFSNPTWNSYSYHFMVQLAAGSTRLVTCYKLRIFFPFRSCELRDLWEVAGCYWCWLGKAVVDGVPQTTPIKLVCYSMFWMLNFCWAIIAGSMVDQQIERVSWITHSARFQLPEAECDERRTMKQQYTIQ